jgi:phosphoglycolate phosphatase-like HAD superfamily hydrolase
VIRAALFDIDGTLFMSSDGTIIDALAEVLGVENRIRELDHPGRTIAWIAAALAGREPGADWCARTEQLYLDRLGDTAHWEARTGSEAMLERLRTAGIRLGLVSGLPERVGKERLRRVGLGRFFDDAPGGYGCESPDRTELVRLAVERVGVEPGEALVVGDTVHDVTAAEEAGARAFMYGRDDPADAVLQAVL